MNTLRCSRLIYLAMRSYVSRMVLVVAAALVIPLVTDAAQGRLNSQSFLVLGGLIGFFPLLISFFTFYMVDKSPQLFVAMPHKRADFVRALYVNALAIIAADLALGFLAKAVLPVPSGFLFAFAMIGFGSILMSVIAIPLAIRFGFARFQVVLFVLLLLLTVPARLGLLRAATSGPLAWVGTRIGQWGQPELTVALYAVALVAAALSYGFSARVYEQKDI